MRLGSLISAAVVVAVLASPGHAQDGNDPDCGAFSLTGGEKIVNVVDQPPQGASPGDLRAGSRQLVNDGGDRVGEVHFKSTLTAAGGGGRGDVLAAEYFVSFPNGWIASHSLYELPDAQDTSQRAGNATLVAAGGTGDFRNAQGTITIEAGDPPTYLFDLTCR